MLYCREVNEILYSNLQDKYDNLPIKVQESLKKQVCNKCDHKLPDMGKIHYIILFSNKLLWWHDNCVTFRRKKHG